MITKNSKIYIAGHNGMVGSACWRTFKEQGYSNLIGKSSKELDLRNQKLVKEFIGDEKPDLIINAAARVGGIVANNSYPYEFLMENLLIQNNLIYYAHHLNIKKFIFLGSSCIYPKYAQQPIKEEYLLTDYLEPTNQWYAIAKISGIKLIEALKKQYNRNYTSLMPTNLYGINDNFDLQNSHVLPALLRKFHEARENNKKEVTLWGDGSPLREFLHADDLAQAVLHTALNDLPRSLYNVGSGFEISIKELAQSIKEIVGYNGGITWDTTKPNGTPRKLMDSSKFRNFGWSARIPLKEGIESTYKWYTQSINI